MKRVYSKRQVILVEARWPQGLRVHSIPDLAVNVRALDEDIVSCSCMGNRLYSHSTSLHLGIKMGTGEFNAGGNSAMD